jgi:RNA polymerase sigma factor (sigma-70 family)
MSSSTDDAELMARVAIGEAAAQRALASRLLPRVDRLCRALLRNGRDAEDARQLSMIEILRAAHNFRGESSVERWADRITVRTALRAIASERKAQRLPLETDASTTHGTGESSVLAREYLDRVSERQRTVLILRHGLDYSIEEIAAIEAISVNTVKDRLLRGRGTMRRMFRRDQLLASSTNTVAADRREETAARPTKQR